VPVGTVLGLIGEEGETVETAAAGQSAARQPETGPAPKPEAPPRQSAAEAAQPEKEHEKASPLVRRLAREHGIDLEQIKGSGPEARITQDDLNSFASGQGKKTAAAAPSAVIPDIAEALPPENAVTTTMRQAIANTVTRSWQTIPHFAVTMEINMDACREVVRELKEGTTPVGYNAMVIKACAVSLMNFPLLHSTDPGAAGDININFAVSRPDGLLMPVIRQCQRLSVAEIEVESSRLAYKSRAGRLTSEEMSGGTFSVSNLGMYGVDDFTALIIPGQTAILTVGAVSERPVAQNGQLAVAATMRVTLNCDHRVIDGAYAAS